MTPSLYEGFGLTALEAMACGIPTIASKRTSLPEVVGDGGLLVEPRVREVAAAMRDVLTTPELAAELARARSARAAQFSLADDRGADGRDLPARAQQSMTKRRVTCGNLDCAPKPRRPAHDCGGTGDTDLVDVQGAAQSDDRRLAHAA